MGCNYYMVIPDCACCGREREDVHIGKSSVGWTFSLHVIPEKGIHSLKDWVNAWSKKEIIDEYGRPVSKKEMLSVITNRKGSSDKSDKPSLYYRDWEDFYNKNNAMAGPNGLTRSKIDGARCIGHGDGCWDLIVGDFC